jgi:hypothetical protein
MQAVRGGAIYNSGAVVFSEAVNFNTCAATGTAATTDGGGAVYETATGQLTFNKHTTFSKCTATRVSTRLLVYRISFNVWHKVV